MLFKALQSLTLRYCWKFEATESPPEGFLSFLHRLEIPFVQTLNVVLQIRLTHELVEPVMLMDVARNIDVYASRIRSITALNILFILDLNFLLQWSVESVKEQLSRQFLPHPVFQKWRTSSKLYGCGVLVVKVAIVKCEYPNLFRDLALTFNCY